MVRRMFSMALVAGAACGPGGGFPDAAVPDAPPPATFSVSWSVIDQNSAPLACERIAAQAMTVLTHNKEFEGGTTQIFTCKEGSGMSQQLYAGLYDMSFELSGTFGTLARAPAQVNVDLPANRNTELAPVQFQVEALGAVDFNFASGKPGGNCGAPNAGGAGIDAMTITMNRNSDLACAPITLTISQGATRPGGTYTIDCTTPVVTGCIEADQRITATNVASDGYTIHIRGRIATKDCYLNDDMIQVPPLQKTLMRTLNLAHQPTVMGC